MIAYRYAYHACVPLDSFQQDPCKALAETMAVNALKIQIACWACRYERGNKFGKHVDESVKIGSKDTRYTLLVYLSGRQDEKGKDTAGALRATGLLQGGETLFYGKPFTALLD